MTHKTRGIVLRTVRYGETSLVVTVFTELFGIQTYMVNGVRKSGKNASRSALYQPGAILDLVVGHQEQKSMQRIREAQWARLYQRVFSDVIRNCVALYLTEILNKCLRQPEEQSDLFYFMEDVLEQLDTATPAVVANLPLFFALQLPQFFGFKINPANHRNFNWLDLQEGCFVEERPHHECFLEGEPAFITAQIVQSLHPEELADLRMHQQMRRNLLHQYHAYYACHVPEFGRLKTIEVLYDVL